MRKLLLRILGVIALGGIVYFAFMGFSEDRKMVHLALRNPEGTFLYTQLAPYAVDMQLQEGQAPLVTPSFELLIDGNALYCNPLNIKPLVSLLTNESTIHPKAEKSFDGYISGKPGKSYTLITSNLATENIGEQLVQYTILLTNAVGKTMKVDWTLNTANGKLTAGENCWVRSFAIKSNPAPGETVIANQKFVVLKLTELIKFMDPSTTFELDKELGVLYIEQI